MKFTTRKLAILAMLTAIATLLLYLSFPIFPGASYLRYDFADIPVLIGAFAFGPIAGIMITVVASFIQAFLIVGDGLPGFLMHVIATSSLVIVAGTFYYFIHSRKGAVIGLILGTLTMTAAMMIANHFLTPLFYGWPVEQVDAVLVPSILPFNLIKAGVNSIITFIVYKVVSKYVVHGEKFGSGKSVSDKA